MCDACQNTHLFRFLQFDLILNQYFYTLCNDIHNSIFKFFSIIYLYLVYLYNSLEKKREIPIEIDDHFKLFGKEPWEVDYGEKCPVCNVRIDEYGFCSCGSSGD